MINIQRTGLILNQFSQCHRVMDSTIVHYYNGFRQGKQIHAFQQILEEFYKQSLIEGALYNHYVDDSIDAHAGKNRVSRSNQTHAIGN